MAQRQSRYRKRDSDRSGFTYKEKTLVDDEGFLVGPDEFDQPPPSEKSLGGEGDVSPGNTRSDYTSYSTPSENEIHVQYVTAAGGIQYEEKTYRSGELAGFGYVYIVGSNNAVDVTANPQISRASQDKKFSLECIGSTVTLENGSGLSLTKTFVMDSGAILNLFYSQTDNLWHETSRSHRTKNLGV